MAKKKAESTEIKIPIWMPTYADLMTVLFTLFVLLFSMSSLSDEKFDAAAESLRNSFSVFNSAGGILGQMPGDQLISLPSITSQSGNSNDPGSEDYREQLKGQIANLEAELAEYEKKDLKVVTEEEKLKLDIMAIQEKKLNSFREQISDEIDKQGIGGYVSIVEEQERLVLRLDSQILFASGSAELSRAGHDVLLSLGVGFRELDHTIEVQGHTDNVPIRTYQYPSNWELSTQRATNVVRMLQDECSVPPSKLRSTGFGEYQPIADNSTTEGRQDNRRIDIVITTE